MKIPQILTAADFDMYFGNDIWLEMAQTICRRNKLSFHTLKRAGQGENIVFFVDDAFIIKIYTPFRKGFHREKASLKIAQKKTSLTLPEILCEGEIEGFDYLIFTQIKGALMTRKIWLALPAVEQMEIISRLGNGLNELHSQDAEEIDFDWHNFIKRQAETVLERQKTKGVKPEWLEELSLFLEENLKFLPENFEKVFLHGDVHFGNLRLIRQNKKWQISGLFDFADSLKGFHEYEFVAPGVLMIQGQGKLQREFFRSYGYKNPQIDEGFRKRLMLLTILYECSDLRKYALRLKPEAVNYSLDELERAIWNFI